MEKAFDITFPNEHPAKAIQVQRLDELSIALHRLGLRLPRSTLVLVGGAGGLSDYELSNLRPLFTEVLVPLIQARGVAVVDGGTDAGVMSLMGQARAQIDANFPLVGVAARGTVALPHIVHSPTEAVPLEPHHTHFVLVPGSDWGDESLWLARVASSLADVTPSLTVLINGGETAWEDVTQSVRNRRPVLAIAGSGRTADTLAAAARGEATDKKATELVASGLLKAVDVTAGVDTVASRIEEFFC